MAPSCGNLTANQTAMVIVGAAAGVAIGALAHSAEASASTIKVLGYAGKLYINGLMLFVVPYICCSMFTCAADPAPPPPASPEPPRAYR